jgi:hypothetical protein
LNSSNSLSSTMRALHRIQRRHDPARDAERVGIVLGIVVGDAGHAAVHVGSA